MTLPREAVLNLIQEHVVEDWRTFVHGMERSMDMLERDIRQAASTGEDCTAAWREAIEHVIEDLSSHLFAISEPRFSSESDSRNLRALKRRLRELYARYKTISAATA
jgi:hemerythrin-like domain-containing protein